MTVLGKDRLKVKPNHVYVIPPNKSLTILDGILNLSAPVERRGLRSIDIFSVRYQTAKRIAWE
jgi:hypothetical protein